jgi:hypothetical protein
MLLAAALLAASAQAGLTELVVHFVTANRDVECEMVDPNTPSGNVTCVLHSKGYTTKGDVDNHGLTAGTHPQWSVAFTGIGQKSLSRREVHGSPLRTLREGQSLAAGYFRCSWSPAGLRCASRHSGHGFLISRERQLTF